MWSDLTSRNPIPQEATVTVEYFRSLQAPTEGPKAAKADTWIGSLVR
jgi:hypothetical protein